jgi:AAA15 family ATPase/GTPase
MLLKFAIENYNSFRDESVFSMAADPKQEGAT